jgi:predicted DNA-binding protein
MTYQTTETLPKVQLPIRINQSLHERFSNLSKRTKIPMSTLTRDAIERHIADIEHRGITAVLSDLEGEVCV